MCAYQSNDDLTRLSRRLAWILRHGAAQCNLNLSSDGYASIDEILQKPEFSSYTKADVRQVVNNDTKKRFQISRDGSKIRATQGHTLPEVDDEQLLTPITSAREFPTVVHGTSLSAWNRIKTEGLKRMRRKHIHFAKGLPGDTGVLSGMKTTCDIAIYLDVDKALRNGIRLFKSANDVILSEGQDGVILPRYFKKVINRHTNEVLHTND